MNTRLLFNFFPWRQRIPGGCRSAQCGSSNFAGLQWRSARGLIAVGRSITSAGKRPPDRTSILFRRRRRRAVWKNLPTRGNNMEAGYRMGQLKSFLGGCDRGSPKSKPPMWCTSAMGGNRTARQISCRATEFINLPTQERPGRISALTDSQGPSRRIRVDPKDANIVFCRRSLVIPMGQIRGARACFVSRGWAALPGRKRSSTKGAIRAGGGGISASIHTIQKNIYAAILGCISHLMDAVLSGRAILRRALQLDRWRRQPGTEITRKQRPALRASSAKYRRPVGCRADSQTHLRDEWWKPTTAGCFSLRRCRPRNMALFNEDRRIRQRAFLLQPASLRIRRDKDTVYMMNNGL